MALFRGLLNKSLQKLESLYLRVWAFSQLWWVDRHLQAFATDALKTAVPTNLQLLNQAQKQAIQRRVAVISWTAGHHPCHPQCLHKSLVLYRWLHKQGIAAQLEVGWKGDIGHAWVSYNEQVLNDKPDVANYTPPLKLMSERATGNW